MCIFYMKFEKIFQFFAEFFIFLYMRNIIKNIFEPYIPM